MKKSNTAVPVADAKTMAMSVLRAREAMNNVPRPSRPHRRDTIATITLLARRPRYVALFLCLALTLIFFTACKKADEGPEAPALTRLSALMQDPATEIDSYFTMEKEDLNRLAEAGWELHESTINATEKRSPFLLPEWLWKAKDFRMRFTARSALPRQLVINVQGKELARHQLTSEWKEFFIQYSTKDLKRPTVKQIMFIFQGTESEKYAELKSIQLPLYSWGRSRLAQEVRSALSVNSKSKVRFHLKLPPKKPALFFGFGVPVEKGKPGQAQYTVRIVSGGNTTELLSKSLKFPQPYTGWRDEKLDLSKYAGKKVTLEFQADSTADRNHYVAWSSPEIYDVAADRDQPNVILLSIDTMRADRLNDHLTPNLMKFARKSDLFTNAYCTFPSTLPSHTSLMTGLYVANHQVSRPVEDISRVKQIPHNLPTMAEIATAAKYFAAGITDGGFVSAFFGFDRGFQQYSDNIRMARKDVATISNAISWLRTNSERPFFLFLHSYEVHEPFNPPPHVFKKLFPTPALNRPPVITMDYLHRINSGAVIPSEKDKEFIRQCYDAEVHFFDQNFGRFLAELENQKLDRNTVIIVFADHGELFLEDRDKPFGHGKTLTREEIHIPLIVHVPGRKPAVRSDIVSLVDIFPTVAEIIGAKVNSQLDGISLLEPADSKMRFNRSIYYEVTYGKEALWGTQTREFKLVLDKQKGVEYFYDLRKDPAEKAPVTAETRSLQKMKELLAAYVQKSTSPTDWAKAKKDTPETNELREQLKALGYIN